MFKVLPFWFKKMSYCLHFGEVTIVLKSRACRLGQDGSNNVKPKLYNTLVNTP